jgi:hypothetical protein
MSRMTMSEAFFASAAAAAARARSWVVVSVSSVVMVPSG